MEDKKEYSEYEYNQGPDYFSDTDIDAVQKMKDEFLSFVNKNAMDELLAEMSDTPVGMVLAVLKILPPEAYQVAGKVFLEFYNNENVKNDQIDIECRDMINQVIEDINRNEARVDYTDDKAVKNKIKSDKAKYKMAKRFDKLKNKKKYDGLKKAAGFSALIIGSAFAIKKLFNK